jgi:alkyldihydroxyacetonephosphate synthase
VPQSYEWATVGGCAATRSAGQSSTGHGRIDAQVAALECVTPVGSLATLDAPGTAAGPSLRQLVLGSEGAFGVITRVALRVRPLRSTAFDGWTVGSFFEGAELLRRLEQEGIAPDIARLSDEEETRLSVALAGTGSLGRRLLDGRCLLVCGWEGAVGRASAARVLARGGARPLGGAPGRAWERSRFAGPHLRDDLMDRGVLVETLETATTWSRVMELHDAVGAAIDGALRARGTPPLVMCHVSHVYRTGASLYYTFVARQQEGAELEQWHAAKAAASDAILAGGGTITHHHGVGRDHAPWLPAEVGPLGIELLGAAKATLDPAGIMNPGKLMDPPSLPGADVDLPSAGR